MSTVPWWGWCLVTLFLVSIIHALSCVLFISKDVRHRVMKAEGVGAYATESTPAEGGGTGIEGQGGQHQLPPVGKQQEANAINGNHPPAISPLMASASAGLMTSKKADASFFSTYFQLDSGTADAFEIPTTFHTRIGSDSLGDPHLKLA
mmetsp:Transcript_49470/g.56988  ORF Transcript_49470/g.56988 Transcript_49470/m.56988 type:complete len:149 (-) Transcript_49470:37-483(-)